MMASYYPIALDLRGRACLVVGGGPIAESKVEGLLDADARVTVVSPEVTHHLAEHARAGRIRHVAREYRAEDVAGNQLVFAATGNRAVTEAVARDGRERGVWVNAADDPAFCDFLLPSVLRRGRLVVAVSTSGACPGLARAIRQELEEHLTEDYAPLVELVAEVRRELRGSTCVPAADAWRRALDADLRALIVDGRREEAKARLRARLREPVCP
jgi:precorrin-2 dehydrogenase/sirohydrochlorin ferrochelatase